ncbi:MAG: Dihydropteroate synthase [Acetothermia bacterium 64_32]|nr:MAG: Dihydropteroate synthase [Acetothermia bacterium 64_32]HAF70698.1 dihydropteroate synthase [Candidatus Acetothermia bacterium]
MFSWRDLEGEGRVLIMGILNVTPDSFSDGGRFLSPDAAVERALVMEGEGADIIDIGGESSRPGAEPVSVEEELGRVLPVLERLRGRLRIPISIDTTKAEVAEAALRAGASIVNDISALRFDPAMAPLVAEFGAGLVLMHMLGTPKTMQQSPHYDDVVREVRGFLAERAQYAQSQGIPREAIAVDPGIGFGKTVEHNLELLRRLPELVELGFPVLVGPSRKSFIGAILDLPVEERLEGTLAACAVAVVRGADILRVHDVRQVRRAADLAWHLRRGR